MLAGQDRRCALPIQAADGTLLQVELELHPRRDGVEEKVCGAVASLLLRDVTALNQALTDLTDLAFQDPLTGLANAEASRRSWSDASGNPPRGPGWCSGLILMASAA